MAFEASRAKASQLTAPHKQTPKAGSVASTIHTHQNMRVVVPLSLCLLASTCASAWTTTVLGCSSSSSSASFLLRRRTTTLSSVRRGVVSLSSTPESFDSAAAAAASEEEEPSLLLGDDIESQMANLRSKYPTGEADYLAAARARSEAKTSSTSHEAANEEWKNLADEKKRTGELEEDAWEASMAEAGNADSQMLIPMNDPNDASEDPEEPKLLLF